MLLHVVNKDRLSRRPFIAYDMSRAPTPRSQYALRNNISYIIDIQGLRKAVSCANNDLIAPQYADNVVWCVHTALPQL